MVKMKFPLLILLFAGLCPASTLPDTVGAYHRTATSQPAPATPVWNELGLKESETAAYENGSAKFKPPSTPAGCHSPLSAFDWLRSANSTPSPLANLAADTPTSLPGHANYVLEFDGYKPTSGAGPGCRRAQERGKRALPTLFLPSGTWWRGAGDNHRTVGLQRFSPAIPPSVAAFHLGAEAELAVFHSPGETYQVLVFKSDLGNLATAGERFGKIPGAMVKRFGPLVAVTLAPADPDLADNVLEQIAYKADVTFQEHVPTLKDNIGNLVINAFILIGILLVLRDRVRARMVGGCKGLEAARKGDRTSTHSSPCTWSKRSLSFAINFRFV